MVEKKQIPMMPRGVEHIKKLLTIFLLTTLTLTVMMPEDAFAKGRRGKAVAVKKSGRVAKAKAGKGGRKAVVVRGKGKRGAAVATSRRGRGKYGRRSEDIPRVSRTTGVAIPPDRVREIQTALKREGYLQAEPSGEYDRTTVEAMTKYQQDRGFRSTGYPTAESLQKLGLTRQRRVTQPNQAIENKSEANSNTSTPPQMPVVR